MMISISKSLPRNCGELLNRLSSRATALVYELLPQIELALASWTLKDLWESLVHDSLDVNYETRPLLPSSPDPPCPKVAWHSRAAEREKR